MKKNNLKKNFVWNSIGSTINASISLFFMIIATRINGVEKAGVFIFAYSFACLVQVIATYSGRPYQVTENNKSITNSDYFWMRLLMIIVTIIVALLFVLIKQYSLFKIVIIFLAVFYRITEAISDYYYSCIQKYGELHIVGKSLLIKGVLETIIFLIIDFLTKSLIISLISIIICNVLVCIFYDIRNSHKLGNKVHSLRKKQLKELVLKGFPVFAFTILIQYLVSAQKYSIDSLMASKYQTVFGIIVMPATVLVLVSQFIVQPILTMISELINKKDYHNLNKLIIKVSIYVALIGLTGIVGAYIIGTEILSIIYGISLKQYRIHLTFIMVGSVFFALSYVLSSVMTALRITISQLVIYIIASIIAFLSSMMLIKNYGLFGAVTSYMIVMILLYVMYVIVFACKKKRLKNE